MKKPIIIASILLAGITASAEVLSPDQALQRVSEAAPAGARKVAARAAVDATPARVITQYGVDPELYLFTPADGGVLLVSADSETPALLGYTDEANTDGSIPPALEYLMNCYAEEIHAMRAGNVVYGDAPAAEDFAPIDILTPVLWNQGGPYNDMCPALNGNDHYVTGCVATAMAQVLYSHKYPANCIGGEYTYHWAYEDKDLTINFDDVALDWDNMHPTYDETATQSQREEVAQLMKAVGYATNMNYTPGGSGSHGFVMAAGLVKYFDYDITTTFIQRRWYSLAEWKKIIYDELAAGHAVYMDAQTGMEQVSAHAFMLDGYQGDGFFHVNWGWGGLSNGYFLLTTMSPSAQGIGGSDVPSGYCASQGIIVGMNHGRKGDIEDTVPTFFTTGELSSKVKSAALGENVQFSGAAYFYLTAICDAKQVSGAMKFTHENGTEYWSRESEAFNIPSSITGGIYSLRVPAVNIPEDLPEGNYVISPAVYSNHLGRYVDVYTSVGMGGKLAATVSGSTISFSEPEVSTLTLTSANMVQKVSINQDYTVSLTLTNPGADSYDGYVNGWLVKPGENKMRASFNRLHTHVAPGETVNAVGCFNVTDGTVPSGDYEVFFLDQHDNVISERFPVKFFGRADAGELTGVKIACTADGKDELAFEVTVKATEGSFHGKVSVDIRQKSETMVTLTSKSNVTIKEGESATVTVTGKFPAGKVGEKYTGFIMYTRAGEKTEARGSKKATFTLLEHSGIDELKNTDVEGLTEYFDLSGRRVVNPTKSLYIKRCGKETEKIAF